MGKYILGALVALFPYSLFLGMYCLYTPSIMETVFFSNGFLLIGAVLLCAVVAVLLSCILVILAIVKKYDALAMARLNMIIKLCQIPAYVVIFVLGFFFFISVFGIGFAIVFVVFDCAAIVMSGMVGAVSAFRAYAEKRLMKSEGIVFGLLQFIFVADVAACILLYVHLKRGKKQEIAAAERPV